MKLLADNRSEEMGPEKIGLQPECLVETVQRVGQLAFLEGQIAALEEPVRRSAPHLGGGYTPLCKGRLCVALQGQIARAVQV